MSSWQWIDLVGVLLIYGISLYENGAHKKEIEHIHESYAEERKELLDRIMANNIHEYQAARGEYTVKKSETGNFLRDRFEKTAQKAANQFDIE